LPTDNRFGRYVIFAKIEFLTASKSYLCNMKNNAPRSQCALNVALEIFGDKWSLLILRDMLFFNKSQYSEYLASDEGISTNILADRLLSLENTGMIEKRENARPGVRAQYFPTPLAMELLPVMLEMIVWSEKHFPVSARARQLVQKIHRDRAGLIAELNKRWAQNRAPACLDKKLILSP
jgi:DNA-binding HxlR family transcriptional regulator